jgi:hypothetical protein
MRPRTLLDYRHDFTHGEYDTLIYQRGARTLGSVFDVQGADLAKLDKSEVGYQRRAVRLTDGLPAWTYFEKLVPTL